MRRFLLAPGSYLVLAIPGGAIGGIFIADWGAYLGSVIGLLAWIALGEWYFFHRSRIRHFTPGEPS